MEKKYEYKGSSNNPLITIVMAVFAIFVIFALFKMVAFVTKLLGIIAPVLLVATAIIDFKVLVNFVKMIVGLFQRNVLLGIGASVLSIIGIPFVAVFLFSKALLNRKVRKVNEQMRQEEEGEFVNFEEIVNKEKAEKEVEILELEEPEKRKSNEYETLFEDAEIEEENSANDKNDNLWD
ncbi:MAG: hypothetical protein AAF502_08605 [Bacteroidota bacterium]